MKQEIQTALEWLLALETEGYEGALVGGAVRALFLGLPITEEDIATAAPLDVVLRLRHGANSDASFARDAGILVDNSLCHNFSLLVIFSTGNGSLTDPTGF